MATTGNVQITGNVSESQSYQLGTPKATNNLTKNYSYAAGSGSNQIDVSSGYTETLGAAGSTDHTLSDGSMSTPLKENATFTAVKFVVIKNTGDTNSLTVSGNFWGISTEDIEIPAGGFFAVCYGAAGETVTGTSKDVITIASTSGTTYELLVAGVGSIS